MTMKSPSREISELQLAWLGQIDYELALEKQFKAAEAVRNGAPGIILACEHDPVITMGKRGQPLNDVLVSMDVLLRKKIHIVATDRGGQATFHNPGQLVLYPILPLRRWELGVRKYVECLELTAAYFFAERGVEVTRGFDPGLWVDERKIGAFGIRVDRGVSLHGSALNICNELTNFGLIKICGQRVSATNLASEMSEFGSAPEFWNLQQEAKRWMGLFKNQLDETFCSPTANLDKLIDLEIPNELIGLDTPNAIFGSEIPEDIPRSNVPLNTGPEIS